ncbi:Hypothetical predicted protein, partial [Pelobates cultripes]
MHRRCETPASQRDTLPTTHMPKMPFQSQAELADPEGRYIFVKGTIAGHQYTLACVYAPNTAQHHFLTRTLHALDRFREGLLILAGDLNLALDPRLDTSLGTSSLPASYQRKALVALKNAGLADSWRVVHPQRRDYSYYSTVHSRYSRLDYIFLPIEYLSLLHSSGIHTATWSDHAPVWTKIASPLYRPRERQWRLNEQVLEELEVTVEMGDALQKYFEENTTPDVEPPMIWEAHKCMIRGHLIRYCTQRKTAQRQAVTDLAQQVATLETLHKSTLSEDTYRELLEARRNLKQLLSQGLLRTIRRSRRHFYEYSDKCGRLLARRLQRERRLTHITKIRDQTGVLTQRPDGIATAFHHFYTDLYNIPETRGAAARKR